MAKKNKTLMEVLDLILYENPSTQDEIAEKLGIKLHRVDFIQEYWDSVFEYFLAEYILHQPLKLVLLGLI